MSGDFRFDFSKKSKGKKAVKPVPENLDEMNHPRHHNKVS